jgi:hypothetical protein
MKIQLLLSLSLLTLPVCHANDYYSIRDGSWFVATNTWSPAGIPSTGDNVAITNQVFFDSTNASQSVATGNLNLTDARLNVSGPATLTMAGTASVLAGSNFLTGVLYNQGIAFQSGDGTLAMPCGTHFENLAFGVYDLAGDGNILLRTASGGALPYFKNYGQLRKSSGMGVALFTDVYFNNQGGTVQVDSGTLRLGGGGTSSNGTFSVATGATLDWTGGSSTTWAGAVGGTGAGTVSLHSGTVSANPNLTLNLSDGLFHWTGGTLAGTTTNLNTITVAGSNTVELTGVLYNNGLVRHTNIVALGMPCGAHLDNQADGTYDLAGDGSFYCSGGGGTLPYFKNYGQLRKSSGMGVSLFTDVPFNNQGGAVDVDSGTLRLGGSGTSSNGTFTVATGATLDWTGGSSPTWAGVVGGSGAGIVSLNSGTVSANPSLTLNLSDGLFQWTGGTIGGTTTNVGTITVAGTDAVRVTGVLYNRGLVRHTNTVALGMPCGARLENLADGTYDLTGDGSFYCSGGGGALPYFKNYGQLRKSSGVGVSLFTDVPFNNQGGAVEVDSGTLRVSAYAQGGGALTIALGGSGSGQAGQLSVSGNATLNGPLNVVLTNGFTPAPGQQFQILSCGSRSGVFTATNMPTGLSLSYSNSGAYLLVTSLLPRALEGPATSGTNFTFSFQTESGASYTVQYNDNLTTTNWLFHQAVTGDGSVLPCVIPMTNTPQRFFRVRQP